MQVIILVYVIYILLVGIGVTFYILLWCRNEMVLDKLDCPRLSTTVQNVKISTYVDTCLDSWTVVGQWLDSATVQLLAAFLLVGTWFWTVGQSKGYS